jgi:hypothetical protein
MAIAVDVSDLGGAVPADAATGTFNTSGTVAAGGFIVLFCGHFNDTPTLTSVGGGGLTWTSNLAGPNSLGAGGYAAIVSAPAPSGLASGTTITVTWGGSAVAQSLGAMSFTGVSGVDVAGTVQSFNSGTATTTGNISVAAGSVLVGGFWSEAEATAGGGTITAPSTKTAVDVDTSRQYGQMMGYRLEASAGTVAVAGAWATSSGGHMGLGVAYEAVADVPPNIEDGFAAPAGMFSPGLTEKGWWH